MGKTQCLGHVAGARRQPNAGARVDAGVIAVDVESVHSGKALGASRALELLLGTGKPPERWITVGDSASDYAMADWLYQLGLPVWQNYAPVRAPVPRVFTRRCGASLATTHPAHDQRAHRLTNEHATASRHALSAACARARACPPARSGTSSARSRSADVRRRSAADRSECSRVSLRRCCRGRPPHVP